jgi:hypothetical protein
MTRKVSLLSISLGMGLLIVAATAQAPFQLGVPSRKTPTIGFPAEGGFSLSFPSGGTIGVAPPAGANTSISIAGQPPVPIGTGQPGTTPIGQSGVRIDLPTGGTISFPCVEPVSGKRGGTRTIVIRGDKPDIRVRQ